MVKIVLKIHTFHTGQSKQDGYSGLTPALYTSISSRASSLFVLNDY